MIKQVNLASHAASYVAIWLPFFRSVVESTPVQ